MAKMRSLFLFFLVFVGIEKAELCSNCINGKDSSSGCKAKSFGANCSQPCEGNCYNVTCHVDSGHCLACPQGWKGFFCNETCPANCDDAGCNLDGACHACVNGKFHGGFCSEPCDAACKDCFQNNGTCSSCPHGKFGVNCESSCSSQCVDNKCDQQGNCLAGCNDKHLYGPLCEIKCSSAIPNCLMCIAFAGQPVCFNCSSARFGPNCEFECPDHCELCTGLDGCSKCAVGYSGTTCSCTIPDCTECDGNGLCVTCIPGKFGDWCEHFCLGCETCTSNGETNKPVCLTCKEGLYLNSSHGECLMCPSTCEKCSSSSNCSECKPGYHGPDCSKECPACLPDVTGEYVCDSKTGACSGDCNVGFYGEFCNKSCYDNCGTSSGKQGCNKWNGECFTCKDGFYGQHCNMSCGVNCVPVPGKDRCDKDTGKCVQCKNMFYGDKCEMACPINCDKFCHKELGKCDVCKSGFKGQYCGESCPRNCGPEPGSANIVCNNLNGECLHCKPGFYGEMCTQYCETRCAYHENFSNCEKSDGRCIGCQNGYYGEVCELECPHCVGKTCHQETGQCVKGCNLGWFNMSCNERCSSACKEETCDQLTGVCLKGCVGGFKGQFCKKRASGDGADDHLLRPALIFIISVAVALVLLAAASIFRVRKCKVQQRQKNVTEKKNPRRGRCHNRENVINDPIPFNERGNTTEGARSPDTPLGLNQTTGLYACRDIVHDENDNADSDTVKNASGLRPDLRETSGPNELGCEQSCDVKSKSQSCKNCLSDHIPNQPRAKINETDQEKSKDLPESVGEGVYPSCACSSRFVMRLASQLPCNDGETHSTSAEFCRGVVRHATRLPGTSRTHAAETNMSDACKEGLQPASGHHTLPRSNDNPGNVICFYF